MNAKSARRKRRAKTQKVRHLNKMEMAPTLIGIEPPSRIFFKAIEGGTAYDVGHRVTAYICNRTHILAMSHGPHPAAALMMAATTLKDEVSEESWYELNDDIDHDALTGEVAAAAMAGDEDAVEAAIARVNAQDVGPGAYVGTNRHEPQHYICPTCEAGLNERCVSTRNGAELKTLHADRRRLAVEAKD